MDRVKRVIHCDRAYRMGLSGNHITVAVMDTGIAPHIDFGQRILYFQDFCNGKLAAYDDNGHGTHISGIIGGDGRMSKDSRGIHLLSGIAPRVNLIALKVLDKDGNGVTDHVIEAIDWILKNKEKYKIRILNISVGMVAGARKEEQERLLHAVEEVWNQGIMVITASGNNGPKENSVTIPGISRKVLTVGSWDDYVTEKGKRPKHYSGVGPTSCCILKPEILAPGTNVKSCSRDGRGYSVKSGTSMAAPVVTGAVALAYEKYPDHTPADMKLKLYESAYPRGEQLGRKCWGMLHVGNLVV